MTSGKIIKFGVLLPRLPEPGSRIGAADVERWEEQIKNSIMKISDIEELEEWLRIARMVEAYLRSPELQRPMLGSQRRVEARIGQLLGPAPGRGSRTDLTSRHAAKLPWHHDVYDTFRLLARVYNDECALTDAEWHKSRRALASLIRLRCGLLPETPLLPEGQFSCIVADPPWRQDTGPDVFGGTGERGHDHLAYEQLSVDKIAELCDPAGRPVIDCAADDAHLYLWTINKYVLEEAPKIVRAWGFKPSVLLTWRKKPRGVGLGDTFKLTSEFILFCRRGSLPHIQTVSQTVFDWPRGRHSQKPDEFYTMVEGVTPGRRLDMFARRKREGWTCWGDEVEP